MIYDESSRSLKARELARLQFRRQMELGMAAALAGGVAAAIGSFAIAMRSRAPWLVVVPLAVVVPLGAVFFSRWRSPPKEAIERFASQIRAARKAGTRTAALSRGAVAGVAVLAFVFSLGVVHFLAQGSAAP